MHNNNDNGNNHNNGNNGNNGNNSPYRQCVITLIVLGALTNGLLISPSQAKAVSTTEDATASHRQAAAMLRDLYSHLDSNKGLVKLKSRGIWNTCRAWLYLGERSIYIRLEPALQQNATEFYLTHPRNQNGDPTQYRFSSGSNRHLFSVAMDEHRYTMTRSSTSITFKAERPEKSSLKCRLPLSSAVFFDGLTE